MKTKLSEFFSRSRRRRAARKHLARSVEITARKQRERLKGTYKPEPEKPENPETAEE